MSRTTNISVRLADDLLERIDKMAEEEGRTRSNMIDRLLVRGLAYPAYPEPLMPAVVVNDTKPSVPAAKNASVVEPMTVHYDLHPEISRSAERAAEQTPPHEHKKVAGVLGLDQCGCGAVKGKDGVWRLP